MKNLRNVGIVISIIGAVITMAIMYSTTSAVGGLSDLLITLGFYVWAILPFVVLIILTALIHRKGLSPAARVAILLTSILVVASSVLIYWGSIFNSESSTSALVFIFIPIYSLAAIAVVYGLALLLLKSFMPTSRA
jgi:glucan phosphoethanolaminetransferase (alkaline phosphatase superfamily)